MKNIMQIAKRVLYAFIVVANMSSEAVIINGRYIRKYDQPSYPCYFDPSQEPKKKGFLWSDFHFADRLKAQEQRQQLLDRATPGSWHLVEDLCACLRTYELADDFRSGMERGCGEVLTYLCTALASKRLVVFNVERRESVSLSLAGTTSLQQVLDADAQTVKKINRYCDQFTNFHERTIKKHELAREVSAPLISKLMQEKDPFFHTLKNIFIGMPEHPENIAEVVAMRKRLAQLNSARKTSERLELSHPYLVQRLLTKIGFKIAPVSFGLSFFTMQGRALVDSTILHYCHQWAVEGAEVPLSVYAGEEHINAVCGELPKAGFTVDTLSLPRSQSLGTAMAWILLGNRVGADLSHVDAAIKKADRAYVNKGLRKVHFFNAMNHWN